jgi:hypothetical protein
VQQGVLDPRDANLVVRTLLAAFTHEGELLLRLKGSKPLFIRLLTLMSPGDGMDFDGGWPSPSSPPHAVSIATSLQDAPLVPCTRARAANCCGRSGRRHRGERPGAASAG